MSLFDLPEDLPRESKYFLGYIACTNRYSGLCPYLCGLGGCSYTFLKREINRIFNYEVSYPIEVALLEISGNWLHNPELYYDDTDFNDLESPTMKLRFWWAYNLAVAYARQNPA